MSFETKEISAEEGRPTRLYIFSMDKGPGSGTVEWRYTSANHDILSGGNLFKAIAINDTGIRQTGESNTDAMTINAPSTIGPAAMYMSGPPPRSIGIRIFNKHEGDNQVRASYVGEISQMNLSEPGHAVITCETLQASMNRDGLRMAWQRTCPYALYDPLTCKVDKETHRHDVTITDMLDALTVVTDFNSVGFSAVYLAGGLMEWEHPVRGKQYRMIENPVANIMNMFSPCDDLVIGQSVALYPGCQRTTTICSGRFFNLANYGGFPAMPGKSPFDGDPIF